MKLLRTLLHRRAPGPQPKEKTAAGDNASKRLRLILGGLLTVAALAVIGVALGSGDAEMESQPPPPSEGAATNSDDPAEPAASTMSLANPSDQSVPVTVTLSYPFIWPAEGPITSEIGPWHPHGIDIGLDYGLDQGVRAAAGGLVRFAGGSESHAFGFHVIITHDAGVETIYAHLERVFAEEGVVVRQGDLLGLGGDTGHADGKHLHFEIRKEGSQINPLDVLPEQGNRRPPPLALDCAKEALVLDSGAPAIFDFGSALPSGELIRSTDLAAVNDNGGALRAQAATESDRTVSLETAVTLTGLPGDAEYALTVAPASAGRRELTCSVLVRTRTVRTVFYVRPTNTPTPVPPEEEQERATPTITPTPTNTPTPTPTPTPTKTAFPVRQPSNNP